MSSKQLNETQLNYLDLVINDKAYNDMSREQKGKLINKTDNFLEAVYIAPELFDLNTFKVLKYRETKLTQWRRNSEILGGFGYLATYAYYKLFRSVKGFYFRNFMTVAISTLVIGYFSGRAGEYLANKLYYEKILFKLAMTYNISDDEIEDLQYKVNETILQDNKEEETKKSGLDNVTFKF